MPIQAFSSRIASKKNQPYSGYRKRDRSMTKKRRQEPCKKTIEQ